MFHLLQQGSVQVGPHAAGSADGDAGRGLGNHRLHSPGLVEWPTGAGGNPRPLQNLIPMSHTGVKEQDVDVRLSWVLALGAQAPWWASPLRGKPLEQTENSQPSGPFGTVQQTLSVSATPAPTSLESWAWGGCVQRQPSHFRLPAADISFGLRSQCMWPCLPWPAAASGGIGQAELQRVLAGLQLLSWGCPEQGGA